VRTTQLSRSNTNTNFHSSNRPRAIAPPPHRVPLASSSTSSHSAKRRRSEPEPDHFKTKEVGLGVMNMPQQSQGDGPIEFLSTPSDETGHGYASNINKPKERPGMRRTASDSAATALELSTHSHSHQSRSPTPPLLESLKSTHLPLAPSLQTQGQAGLLASVALSALVDSPLEDIQRALAELKFTREGLMALQPELTSFFGRFCLEQEMSAVSLDVRLCFSGHNECKLMVRIDLVPLIKGSVLTLHHIMNIFHYQTLQLNHHHLPSEWIHHQRFKPLPLQPKQLQRPIELDHSLPPQ